ncbi:hypothetical protein A3F08_00680 [Candidatus Berkelbacteria bacterium RIFCSPHIGHO2_12_FULL_36_9]|uniref:Uncharacterized protein n=1 Tax=Candidatus Berkelbacteria bacterium RIFCSPHIGHO2_12_FULL_36_9 TaxID=1797469 RepID=A0A1F5EJ31_9BACT|nr:MAG: hypothetical protein A3F08_00680 [Candidatus Berkelbacteria bacterium RIFCSPHIGHO2_12_FULL_36_9]
MMNKGVIFANPPAIAREGQQRRGMFPLPFIALADALDREVQVESISPDLLNNYSLTTTILSQSSAAWIAITCYQETMQAVLELVEIAKKHWKKVVLGGHHVNIWGGDRILKEIPEVDFAIMGEGEIPLKMLIEAVDPKQIPGIWWRENGEPKTNILPLYFNDWVNRPPMTRGYSSFDYSALWARNQRIGRTGYSKPFSVIGIRGCAYAQRNRRRCTFCAIPLSNRLRCRNPKYFWEEIIWATHKYGIDLVWEHSDSFLGSTSWLAKLVKSRPPSTPPIWCYGRADEITTQTIESISKIGIEHIYIGIEVGSDQRLEEIQKGITLDQALNAIRLCHKHNIRIQPSFIVGLPGETKKSLQDTIAFAFLCKQEGADDIVFHEFILRKGLPWFETLALEYPALNRVVLDQGLLQNVLWQRFNPSLKREKALEMVQKVLQKFPNSELTAWNI